MARTSEYYRGKRKKRNRILIPAAILLGLLSLVVVLFYGMQKYAVITKDAVRIVPPILENTVVDESGEIVERPPLETTTVEIVYDVPDYSDVEARTGDGLEPLRAIFVKADEMYPEKVEEYAARLVVGNALVLEMKPRSGALKWEIGRAHV